ncbi:hypothetical protein BCR32DRAFT_288110, partial [Anaeromyces robustus]
MKLYNTYPIKENKNNLIFISILSGVLFISVIYLNCINKQKVFYGKIENLLRENHKSILINNTIKNDIISNDINLNLNSEALKYEKDDDYILNYKGGELEPEWEWVKNISILYTWVDGSDIDFLEEKSKYNGGERDINSRFRSADELRYSIRSVEKYLPWHEGNIYILTAQQIPQWLNTTNSKIKMVYHKDVIPKHVTPTYDSGTIELYLDKIPGITEQFLFFNDDVFLNNYVHPAFFFTTKEHYPKIYLERLVKFNKKMVHKELNRNDINNNFYSISYHTDLIIKKYFDPKFKYYYLEHTVHVFYRDLMEPFRQLFENELNVVISDRFRNPYKPHTLYLFLMFQHYATKHPEFPHKFGGQGKAKDFKGYELPKDRTIQKYSSVLNYPKEHEGRIKFGRINDNLKANQDEMIFFKTHSEVLVYNFNDRYTKDEALYQFSEYMITKYPWPCSFEKKEYVELENFIRSRINEIEEFETENNGLDDDNSEIITTTEELLNQPLFKHKNEIVKEYLHLKDSFSVPNQMSTREKEEIESLQNYSDENETLGKEWKWIENISMVYIFDKNKDMEIRKLKYSIQSLIKYLPWFKGKIFIIIAPNEMLVNNLKSSFKDEDYFNQIEILTSDKIVPDCYKDNNNDTHIIEMYLDKIPGLSERFIYLNQNHFFIKNTHPRFFFSNDEFFPKYNLKPSLSSREMRNQRRNDRAFYNTFKLIEDYYGRSYIHHWRFLKNAPCPLYRDLFEPVRQTFKNPLHKSFINNKKAVDSLLPLYLVINYNIYATAQVNYPDYVGGYGTIKNAKAPVLNAERTIEYYGFEETSLFVDKNTMITDLPLTDNLCKHNEFNRRIARDNILFLSIYSTSEIENNESLDIYYLSTYFDDECVSSSNTKVSVILPTYNGAEYLEHGIKAILDQTLKEIELIIINDASTDNTTEILTKYENDNRITIVNLQNNG